MVLGERVQVRLVELAATVRVTVPLKLLREAIVIVDGPATPASTVSDGLFSRMKPGRLVIW